MDFGYGRGLTQLCLHCEKEVNDSLIVVVVVVVVFVFFSYY